MRLNRTRRAGAKQAGPPRSFFPPIHRARHCSPVNLSFSHAPLIPRRMRSGWANLSPPGTTGTKARICLILGQESVNARRPGDKCPNRGGVRFLIMIGGVPRAKLVWADAGGRLIEGRAEW